MLEPDDNIAQRAVSGSVRFVQAASTGAGTVRILIEDVSRAGAAARVVARSEIPITDPLLAGGTMPFRIDMPAIDPAARYAVRVHVDRSGDGQIAEGDRISVQSYPVLTRGAADSVEVEVVAI